MIETPAYARLPALAASLIAVERVIGKPNRVVATVIAALVGVELDQTWTPDRFREVAALVIGAAGEPISKHISPVLQTAIRLVGLELARGTKGRAALLSLVLPFVLRHEDDPEPLRAWLMEMPEVPAKTLRRRAKLAARVGR